ncbi:hypothetical protein Ddc_22458 [Ditylenchus destructor]|nr:hypothetical protein Ddc_22458 [Ditylenchus destructor]
MLLPLNVIVDVLTFSNRNDLDILSEINRYLNRIVQRHFSAKPYRILDGTTLVVERVDNELLLSLTQDLKEDLFLHFDFFIRKWIKIRDGNSRVYPLESMLNFLPLFIRLDEVQIKNKNYAYTAEDFEKLALLSHVWKGRQVSLHAEADNRAFDSLPETISNGVHLALISSSITDCRQLSLHNALDYVSLRDYPTLFLIDTLFITVVDQHANINRLFELIEYKAIIPESKTQFVLDIHRSLTALIHIMAALFVNFSTSWIRCPLRLIIISKEALHSIITSTVAEPCFRMENKETKEVLQMKSITEQEAKKFCHLSSVQDMKFTIVERFSI